MPPENSTDRLFRILGDPTRRRILDLLAEREPLTVGELSAQFPDVGRPNISKHLMALREVELVYATKQGREQHYRINQAAIDQLLRPWVRKYEKYWEQRLDRLREAAEALERKKQEGGANHNADR